MPCPDRPASDRRNEQRPDWTAVTVGEVLALAGSVAVAAVGTWSLTLAQLGHHDGRLALAIGLATTALVGAVALRRSGGRPGIRLDPVELGLLAAVVVAGAVFFLPGFHYTYVDKDPGVYVAHGFAIAREGDVAIDDPVAARAASPGSGTLGGLPGIWPAPGEPGKAVSQFFHLYPALLATAHDLGGDRALFNLNPLLGIGSVAVLVLVTRRVAGMAAALVAAALLVTSMIQVWQARYPSTEIVAQLLLAGALLAAVLAIDRRWSGAALVAGLLLGTGFLVRPDGFLYVGFAALFAAVALALGRTDRRLPALGAGLVVTLPYALWNAYVERGTYTEANDVPGAPLLLGGLALVVAAGYGAGRARRALAARYPDSVLAHPDEVPPRWRVGIGALLSLAIGVGLVVLYHREDLLGVDYSWSVFTGSVTRSYDERTLPWLSWFVTPAGLAVMWVGACLVLLRRWRAGVLVLVGPGTLLLFLYLWDPRVSMRLMWFVRRFVPAVLPAMIILIAIALGWALTRRPVIARVVGAAGAVALVVSWAVMSLPLRHHDEMGGSWDVAAALAAPSGDEQGLFLFPPGQDIYDVMRNAPGAVWFVFDEVAARLPDGYDMDDLAAYAAAFPDMPVFLVERGGVLPAGLPPERFALAGRVQDEVVIWEETRDHRPDRDVSLDVDVSVWRLLP